MLCHIIISWGQKKRPHDVLSDVFLSGGRKQKWKAQRGAKNTRRKRKWVLSLKKTKKKRKRVGLTCLGLGRTGIKNENKNKKIKKTDRRSSGMVGEEGKKEKKRQGKRNLLESLPPVGFRRRGRCAHIGWQRHSGLGLGTRG